jgi:4-hydroxybenzoate polyprenyltransferase
VERGRRVRDSSTEPRIVPFRRPSGGTRSTARPAGEEPVAAHVAFPGRSGTPESPRDLLFALVRALRPAQWLKNAVVFAGLIFGGRLLEPVSLGKAVLAAALFCLLSGGFYLLNDVRDLEADRLHPQKRLRPITAGEITPLTAVRFGVLFISLALAGALLMGGDFVLAMLAYSALMAAYNLGLKDIVILDVFIIAAGFVVRAAAGAIAVEVVISPWLLICTMLLALLIGFGKRRFELVSLPDASRHRRNLETYSRQMLDQSVAVTAAGTLLAYAIYTFDAESAPPDHRMMLTIPIVAFAIFRYLHLIYHKGEGGAPETMLIADRGLLAAAAMWTALSAILFYLSL